LDVLLLLYILLLPPTKGAVKFFTVLPKVDVLKNRTFLASQKSKGFLRTGVERVQTLQLKECIANLQFAIYQNP